MSTITFGSLFAGIGGFDCGLERAGMECGWAAEKDPKCNSVRRRHFPDEETIKDVTDVSGPRFRADILVGGFPCQDISVAGKRAGLAGKRSGLWWEFARIIEEQTPRWVLIENVGGLLSINGGGDLGAILGTLGKLGYGFAYRVLDAQWWGVPQRRRRVFIVGCAGDWRRAAKVLFEPESLPWDSPPSREAGTGVAALTANGVGTCGADDNQGQAGHLIPQLANGLTCRYAKGTDSDATDTMITHTLRAEGFDASEDGTGRGTPLVPVAYGIGSDAVDRSGEGDGSAAQRAGMNITEGRQPTLRARHNNSVAYGMAVRRLMPIECERLQGFPDDWTKYGEHGEEIADGPRYRMLGNAVAVPVAEWIGQRIMEADQS